MKDQIMDFKVAFYILTVLILIVIAISIFNIIKLYKYNLKLKEKLNYLMIVLNEFINKGE